MTIWFFPFFPNLGSPNELTRLYLTRAIVDDGSFSIDGPVSRYGHITDLAKADGRLYSDKAPGISLAGLPVYIVAKALVGWDAAGISNSSLLRLMRIFLAGLPTAAIVVLLFFLLGRLELSRNRRLFLAGAYGLGTIAFPYGVLLFGHQLATLCLVGAFSLIERNNRRPTWLAPLLAGCLLGHDDLAPRIRIPYKYHYRDLLRLGPLGYGHCPPYGQHPIVPGRAGEPGPIIEVRVNQRLGFVLDLLGVGP